MSNLDQHRTSNHAPWITVVLIISVFWGLIVWCIIGITGYFRLSSETAALRTAFMRSVPGDWHKTVAVRVGWFTTGAVRLGSSFFTMPPEPRAALDALHGAEVGIYQLERDNPRLDARAILKAADSEMKSRGWDRIVGVVTERELVVAYWPRRSASAGRVKCCVLVFQGKQLVVSSVRGNLDPLFKLARQHVDFDELKRQLPGSI